MSRALSLLPGYRRRPQAPAPGDHLREGQVLDQVGEQRLLAARRRVFEAIDQADRARERCRPITTARWEREADRARAELCRVLRIQHPLPSWRWTER